MIYFGKLTPEYEEKNIKIVTHFGKDHQYKKFLEEIKELLDEIKKLINFIGYRKNLLNSTILYEILCEYILETGNVLEKGFISELADCQVLAEQLNESDFFIEFLSMSLRDAGLADVVLNSKRGNYLIKHSMEYKIDRTIERYNIQ